eukprot:310937-Pleurochrysis_carterae.AAC.2
MAHGRLTALSPVTVSLCIPVSRHDTNYMQSRRLFQEHEYAAPEGRNHPTVNDLANVICSHGYAVAPIATSANGEGQTSAQRGAQHATRTCN